MNVNEIRASGLLELYVVGQCSLVERETVEEALKSFPELKNDLYQIGAALENYARLNSVMPSDGLKEKILEEVRGSKGTPPESSRNVENRSASGFQWLCAILGLAVLALGYLLFIAEANRTKIEEEFDLLKVQCDSTQQASDLQFAQLNKLQDQNNEILPITSTDKYAASELYLIYNLQSQQNFVQVKSLPNISDQQSFQLWSLKDGQTPIPLTVFQGDEGFFIPVAFEEDTTTYAITIEPRGGRETPTLENLIGTVNVPV